MQVLALTSDRDYYTRAANEDCLNGGPRTRTKYGYDAGTNGVGRLISTSDANHSMSWVYDAHGRVTGKSQIVASITRSVGYGYTNGDMTSLVTPSGQTLTYTYTNHRITSIKVNSTTLLSGVTYDPFGPATGWTWGNGTTVSRAYDQDGNPHQIVTGSVTNGYTVDNASRITGISDSGLSSASFTYGYDSLDRLTSGVSSAITRGYTYDANGNMLTSTGNTVINTTIAPTSNRINGLSGSPLNRTYTYDAAGETTGFTGTMFTFNQRGRVTSRNATGTSTLYTYDAVGQLIEKATNVNSVEILVYDEAGHVLGEYSSTGALIQETVWMDDIPVATIRPSGGSVAFYYVHTDHLGTPRKVTRPADNVLLWRWDPDTFGSQAANANPAGAGTFVYNLRFPGQFYLAESAAHYNGYRMYDPYVDRYLQSDPIGLAGGVNTYAYASANPIQRIDPLGLTSFDYFECLIQQSRGPMNLNCNGMLVQAAINDAKGKVCDAIKCTAHCTLINFVGADVTEAVLNAHREVIEKALEQAAEKSASKAAKRLVPLVGEVETIHDAVGTIRCTINCVKEQ